MEQRDRGRSSLLPIGLASSPWEVVGGRLHRQLWKIAAKRAGAENPDIGEPLTTRKKPY
jgi:hypothetical protein